MSHIHGDPQQMRAFAQALDAWCSETREGLVRLHARLSDMASGDWTDVNYQRFIERFEPIGATILRSLTELDSELAPHVRQLAERYQELLESGE